MKTIANQLMPLTPREVSLILEIRKHPFGTVAVSLRDGEPVRIETTDSILIKPFEGVGLTEGQISAVLLNNLMDNK